ncbi:MAG: hypothetical protein METHP_02125 [Methanoregula sp. SKADARSKE-2]|nr:MAG: hypothetical protein METHP_02125 [Methanoregula sp. SKADARSKE-2]
MPRRLDSGRALSAREYENSIPQDGLPKGCVLCPGTHLIWPDWFWELFILRRSQGRGKSGVRYYALLCHVPLQASGRRGLAGSGKYPSMDQLDLDENPGNMLSLAIRPANFGHFGSHHISGLSPQVPAIPIPGAGMNIPDFFGSFPLARQKFVPKPNLPPGR